MERAPNNLLTVLKNGEVDVTGTLKHLAGVCTVFHLFILPQMQIYFTPVRLLNLLSTRNWRNEKLKHVWRPCQTLPCGQE